MSILPRIFPRQAPDRPSQIRQVLLRFEAKIGGQLFGPVPKGHDRQFFCLDQNTWVWYESWIDKKGKRHSVTTRYDVRPNGIIKLQNGKVYQRLSRAEADNLVKSAELYYNRITAEYNQLQPA
jgi:hypothetical protein